MLLLLGRRSCPTVSCENILNAISDEKALLVFKTIAISNKSETGILRTKIDLSRKQYYSAMKLLMESGLVKRQNKVYSLTSFGKVIYNIYGRIETAIGYYWKLNAIDLIMDSNNINMKLPKQDLNEIVDTLVDDYQIKDILLDERINDNSNTNNDNFEFKKRMDKELLEKM
jgi:predicted transcriptional regulator